MFGHAFIAHNAVLINILALCGKYRRKHPHIMLVCVCDVRSYAHVLCHLTLLTFTMLFRHVRRFWGLRMTPTSSTMSTASSFDAMSCVISPADFFPVATRRMGSEAFQHDNNVDNGIHLRMVQVSWFLWSYFFISPLSLSLLFSASSLLSSSFPWFGLFSLQIMIIIIWMYQQFFAFIF